VNLLPSPDLFCCSSSTHRQEVGGYIHAGWFCTGNLIALLQIMDCTNISITVFFQVGNAHCLQALDLQSATFFILLHSLQPLTCERWSKTTCSAWWKFVWTCVLGE
jgi:hypothetical protein